MRFLQDSTNCIAYIYFDSNRQGEQGVDALLASLVRQLAAIQSSIPGSLKELYNRHEKKQTRPCGNDISTTLHSLAKLYSRVFIVIDALDECQASGSSAKNVSVCSQVVQPIYSQRHNSFRKSSVCFKTS